MRYETQADLLRLLSMVRARDHTRCSHSQKASALSCGTRLSVSHRVSPCLTLLTVVCALRVLQVCRHFAACCFSIRVTRSFDAVRLVIVACLATVADAVMRIRTCDVPSLLCLSYSGLATGPGGPFGFEVRHHVT